jgi:membrane protein
VLKRFYSHLKKIGRWLAHREFINHYFTGLYKRANDHHVFLLAGGLAFSLIICFLPLLFVIFSVLGMLLDQPEIVNKINAFVDRAFPYANQSEFIKQLILARVQEFKLFKNIAGLIGLIGLFFAASGLFSSIRTTLDVAFRLKSETSLFKDKLKDISLVLLVLFFFLFSITILPGFKIAKNFAGKIAELSIMRLGFVGDLLSDVLSFLFIFIVFSLIYLYVPRPKIPIKAVLVSSLSASVLWELAKNLFGFYIANMADYGKVYGAYSLVIVIILWIYYSSLVLIIAAEIGQLYRERAAKKESMPQINN